MNPEVSVVVPTHNRRHVLERLLTTLGRFADDPRVEVIVVDDGSSDGTAGVLSRQDWLISVTQPNSGAASARNAGWQLARAPIVAFIDDDCVPDTGWPLELLGPFVDDDVVGVGGAIQGLGTSTLDSFVAVERLVDHGRDVAGGVDYLVTANAAFRVAALARVDGFDDAFPGAAGEDVDLCWRLRQDGGCLVRGPDAAAVRHEHRSTISGILRTYRSHGQARARLDGRHHGQSTGGAAARALQPRAWWSHWCGYRARQVGPVLAVGLLALRAGGLACFASGRWAAKRSRLR